MRVTFLTLYPESAASARYRVAQFVPRLETLGIECRVWPAVTEEQYRNSAPRAYHLVELRNRIRQIRLARTVDRVVVQKSLTSACFRGMFGRFVRNCPQFLYDIDDAVHLRPPVILPGVKSALQDRQQNRKLMARAVGVLAGNAWLAEEARIAGGRPVLFPTVIDTGSFAPPRDPRTFRVGWMGSPSTASALSIVRRALESSGAPVHIVGARPEQVRMHGAIVEPWSLAVERAHLENVSVGIMPLEKTEWDRGKCALKALLYMACGAPCIATPFGAIRDIIVDGENGLYAATEREWIDALARLRDDAFRQRLGDAARETVVSRFSLDGAAPRLAEILERA